MSEPALPATALDEQTRRNLATRGHWQLFSEHRQRVTELILEAAQRAKKSTGRAGPRLCVLGAGNCNDLDLPRLLGAFSAIHLVDWDGEALAAGLQRQEVAGSEAIRPQGGVDLTTAQARELLRGTEPVEAAASIGVLSQILETAARHFGEGQSGLRAARTRHLELLAEVLAPGGIGLLITDVVSSDTVPQLLTAQDVAIPKLVACSIADRNFFSGLNPAVVLDCLANQPPLSRLVEQIEPISPWRWDLGSRVYAVYGICFRRR